MSTKKIGGVLRLVGQWDETGDVKKAWEEVQAVRAAARALVAGGLDWNASSNSEWVEAVRLMRQIAEEPRR
jgi:hypothetical protein